MCIDSAAVQLMVFLPQAQDVGTSDDSGRASERLNGASVDTSHDRLSDVSMTAPPPSPPRPPAW